MAQWSTEHFQLAHSATAGYVHVCVCECVCVCVGGYVCMCVSRMHKRNQMNRTDPQMQDCGPQW